MVRTQDVDWIPAFAGMTKGYALARYGTQETGAMSIIVEITITINDKPGMSAAQAEEFAKKWEVVA
ncbi:MAG: hypothetical protein LBI31_04990, partial [Zoogloeaceae bacterium]|jgi:hypothetical protein|nr:hypothetical protein [Zoogloeaceae bacterium]